MRSSFNKTIAILLAVILAFSVLTVGVVSASAATDGMLVNVGSSVPSFLPSSSQYVDGSEGKLTVTYWINLQDYDMVNNQWYLSYDPTVLSYNTDEGVNQTTSNGKTTYLIFKFPNAELGSKEFNPYCEDDGVMKGNITKASGFDCYDEGKLPFISITFDIIDFDALETSVYLDLQVLQVRHKNAHESTTPVDFITHSQIVNNNIPFTADSSYTAAYDGDYDPFYGEEAAEVHLDNFKINSLNYALESDIVMQAKVAPAKVASYDSFWVEFTAPGKGTEKVYAMEDLDASGRYVFQYRNIYSNELFLDVDITLHAQKGNVEYYGDAYTTSAKAYVYRQINNNGASGKLLTLLVDLLNYGSAAQEYAPASGYQNEPLINADLTAAQRAAATTNATCTGSNGYASRIDNPTISFTAANCILGSSIQPQIKVKDLNNTGMAGVYAEAVLDGKTYTIDSFKSEGNSVYSFTFDNIYANQLDKQILFTLYDANGTAVSHTYGFSVEAYAAGRAGNVDAVTQNMIDAMIRYGRGAKAYAS